MVAGTVLSIPLLADVIETYVIPASLLAGVKLGLVAETSAEGFATADVVRASALEISPIQVAWDFGKGVGKLVGGHICEERSL